jgi:hypothetical protein
MCRVLKKIMIILFITIIIGNITLFAKTEGEVFAGSVLSKFRLNIKNGLVKSA